LVEHYSAWLVACADGDAFYLCTLWQIVSLVNLNQFIAARGYTFFLGAIYLMFAGLLVAVGLSIWVAQQFQANRFDHVWWVGGQAVCRKPCRLEVSLGFEYICRSLSAELDPSLIV
jgi:hypothetical protein